MDDEFLTINYKVVIDVCGSFKCFQSKLFYDVEAHTYTWGKGIVELFGKKFLLVLILEKSLGV